MPQNFDCPHCAGTTLVADEFAGSHGRCVHCGREVDIPAFRPSPYRTLVIPGQRSWGLTQPQKRMAGVVLGALALIAVIAFVINATIPVWQKARLVGQSNRSKSQLDQIYAALRAYEAANGRLPPPHVVDSAGKPLYSWRVLILPYLEDKEAKNLYQQFHFNERWDSWQNQAAARQMPKVFASPFDTNAIGFNESSYKVIVGPRTLFPPPPQGRTFSEVTDDPHTTIMVVECMTTGANLWTAPDGLDGTKMSYLVGDGTPMQLGGADLRGSNVLFADGSTGVIAAGTVSNLIRGMTTIDGGDASSESSVIWPEVEE